MKAFIAGLDLPTRGTLIVWGVSILIFCIFLVILAVRISNSIKNAEKNNGRINQYLAAIPADKIGTIQAIYQNTRKSTGHAMLLCLMGGSFGFQRIYLGKSKSALAMFLFFWTGIPTIIMFFDLTAMPETISDFNLNVIQSLYSQIASPVTE